MANSKVVLNTKGLDRLIREEPQKVELWLDGFTVDLLSRIVLSFGTSPSAPGGPPGVDTGALRASMHWDKTGPLERTISDGVEYGLYQEDVYNRPFMAPAFKDAQKRFAEDAKQNLGLEDV